MDSLKFKYFELYTRNSRGLQMFTCKWLPVSKPPKAVIFFCHGYGMECSKFMRACGEKLASAGYAVYGIDYEGHGRSAGVRCLITKFDNIVDDCDEFFKSICGLPEYSGKAKFLYGDSMGGAICLLLHKRDPMFWDGAVLVAPMCKISDKLKPHPMVVNLLTKMEDIIPSWKIVPTRNVIKSAFTDDAKRERIKNNKLIYKDKPRLKTALEMMRITVNLQDNLPEVTFPFLILQGENDTVTDPEVSKALYEQANSTDKTLKLYAGMCHGLTTGESDENVARVFSDIIFWLDVRANKESFMLQQTQNYGVQNFTPTSSPIVDNTQPQPQPQDLLQAQA